MRLTFKEELNQLWIASAETTQKGEASARAAASTAGHLSPLTCLPLAVPYSTITKIEGFPIEGNEAYSIVALSLGSGSSSKYWLYYFPSQHVASIKIRILGLESLL